MARMVLHIEGMSCGHCLNAVSQALGRAPGVAIESVQIGRALVAFDPGLTSADAIVAAVAEAGYRATPQSP
jgi:copper chaperone